MRVLVVEDEVDLARTVKQALEEDGFAVDQANDGESGLYGAQTIDYDAVVLDLMLPRMDGGQVLRKLRQSKKTPVLILTARDTTADKVRGLNAGADDYLTKPFELVELLARVRALIRRAADKPSPLISLGEVEVNTAARTVTKAGKGVDLTAKEYALVELLALHRGELVTRTMIYDHIYDEQDDSLSNVVDVYVSNLRRKLGKDFVETRRGQGYILHV
jgi:two-component system, OmpR family, response regulator